MDYERIIGLLDKYWKCETTLSEEEELHYFYKHCRQIPEKLAEYRELFVFQEGERQVLIHIRNPQKDTCQTPEQALAEVRQALNFVSSKMNRGQQLLEENMDEMKWINRYIK